MAYLPALASLTASASPTPFHTENQSADWTLLMLTAGLVGAVAYAAINAPLRPARPGIGAMLAEGVVDRGTDYLIEQALRRGFRLAGQWFGPRRAVPVVQVPAPVVAAPAAAPVVAAPATPARQISEGHEERARVATAERLAAQRAERERQLGLLNGSINTYLQDLSAISPDSYSRFIESLVREYPTFPARTIREIINEKFAENRERIAAFLEQIDSDTAAAAITRNQTEKARLLARVQELRGPGGFAGAIDVAWGTYFQAAKEEIAAFVSICKSLSEQDHVLSHTERQEIFNIHPKSEGSTARLMAIGMRYKAELPANIQARNLTEITAQAPEALRREYDIAVQTKETAFKDYNNRNAEYNDICGEGCDPFDAQESALEGSRIHYLKQMIANPQQEVTRISEFWTAILFRI